VWNLAAFGILWMLRKRLCPAGSVFLLYIALYGAGDLIIRFFREGDPFLFGIQQAQLIGIILLVVSISVFMFRTMRFRLIEPVEAPLDEASEDKVKDE
jgi:prolipoprotein diacylglyceryltransferase